MRAHLLFREQFRNVNSIFYYLKVGIANISFAVAILQSLQIFIQRFYTWLTSLYILDICLEFYVCEYVYIYIDRYYIICVYSNNVFPVPASRRGAFVWRRVNSLPQPGSQSMFWTSHIRKRWINGKTIGKPWGLPSGKLTVCYGKSDIFYG